MATNRHQEQWERLLQVIGYGDAENVKSRAEVLDFGRKIGLEYPNVLYQIRDGEAEISWDLTMWIFKQLPEVNPLWLMGMPQNKILSSPIGAWRVMQCWRWEFGFWEETDHERYLKEEILITETTIQTVSENDDRISKCRYDSGLRELFYEDTSWFVSKLTPTKLEMISSQGQAYKMLYQRIPDDKLHVISAVEHSSSHLLFNNAWRITEIFERPDKYDPWNVTQNFRNSAGFSVWKFNYRGFHYYQFGKRRTEHGYKQISGNVVRIRFSQNVIAHYYIEVEGKNNFSLYVLPDKDSDYYESVKKIRFTRWDETPLSDHEQIIWWLEQNFVQTKFMDNFPLEYIRVWHKATEDTVKVFDDLGYFLCNANEFTDEKYAAAYAFAHASYNSDFVRSQPGGMVSMYRQFLEIIDLWLQLYDRGRLVKSIPLFAFKQYEKTIERLKSELETV